MGIGGTTILHNQTQAMKASIEDEDEEATPTRTITQETQISTMINEEPVSVNKLNASLKEIPTDFIANNEAVFTRLTQPHNPLRAAWIVKHVQYGKDLTPEELEQAKTLVMNYADIFACTLGEVLPVLGATHRLNIPEGTTFNLRAHQRPLMPLQTEFLHEKINEMLKAGIIEHTPPEAVKCCANTVLAKGAHEQEGMTLEELQRAVNKQCLQDGQPPAFILPEHEVPEEPKKTESAPKPQKWRICQNFNEVNRVTTITPMPQGDIRAKQLRLSGHKYISVFDFASRFYAVEIPEDSRPYTAFYVEGRGYFWYKRMPMGLMGTPSTFSEMTANNLHDILAEGAMELFIDNGGCAANNFQEMMNKLERIFQRCRECCISLSPTKCCLFMTETTFAGATVSPEGVQPDLAKLTAVVNWERPADALNLESFLGLTSHFRDLIQGYSLREGPL